MQPGIKIKDVISKLLVTATIFETVIFNFVPKQWGQKVVGFIYNVLVFDYLLHFKLNVIERYSNSALVAFAKK